MEKKNCDRSTLNFTKKKEYHLCCTVASFAIKNPVGFSDEISLRTAFFTINPSWRGDNEREERRTRVRDNRGRRKRRKERKEEKDTYRRMKLKKGLLYCGVFDRMQYHRYSTLVA